MTAQKYPKIEDITLLNGDTFSIRVQVVVNDSGRDHYLYLETFDGDIFEWEMNDDELDVLARKIRTFRYAI